MPGGFTQGWNDWWSAPKVAVEDFAYSVPDIDFSGSNMSFDQKLRAQKAYTHDVMSKAYEFRAQGDGWNVAAGKAVNELKAGSHFERLNSIIRPGDDGYTGPGNYDFTKSANSGYAKVSRDHDLAYMAAQYADTREEYQKEIQIADEIWFNGIRNQLSSEQDTVRYTYYNNALIALKTKAFLQNMTGEGYPGYRGPEYHPLKGTSFPPGSFP